MIDYDQAVEHLVETIQKHDSVVEFQKAEKKIKEFPELDSLVKEMIITSLKMFEHVFQTSNIPSNLQSC